MTDVNIEPSTDDAVRVRDHERAGVHVHGYWRRSDGRMLTDNEVEHVEAELASPPVLNKQKATDAMLTITDPNVLTQFAGSSDPIIRASVAANPHTPSKTLATMYHDNDGDVRAAVAKNPHTNLTDVINTYQQQDDTTRLGNTMILGFDTETTGVHPGEDAIVSATLVFRDPKNGRGSDIVREWVINPHQEISEGASAVNGFTNEILERDGEEPQVALHEISDAVSAAQEKNIPLLAYNAKFDVAMLKGDLKRWDMDPTKTGGDDGAMLTIDPLVIDRHVSIRRGHRTLIKTAAFYGVTPSGEYHDATTDTIAAVDLVMPLTASHEQLHDLSLNTMMDWQRDAYNDWKDSYNDWRASKGMKPITDEWL